MFYIAGNKFSVNYHKVNGNLLTVQSFSDDMRLALQDSKR